MLNQHYIGEIQIEIVNRWQHLGRIIDCQCNDSVAIIIAIFFDIVHVYGTLNIVLIMLLLLLLLMGVIAWLDR